MRWVPPLPSPRSTETGTSASTKGTRPPGCGVTTTARSDDPVEAMTSTPRHTRPRARLNADLLDSDGSDDAVIDRDDLVGAVLAQPDATFLIYGELHAVRQPRPSGEPGTSSTTTSRSIFAKRLSCSATTAALSRRCAAGVTCCQSQPPHRPGP